MANTVFTNPTQEVLTGLDNVIIPQFISGIPGGRTLDMTDYAGSTVSAGHVIITDGAGKYRPWPVHAAVEALSIPAGYDSCPDGWSVAGILACSILASRPAAAIMTAGQVNEAAAPYDIAAVKAQVTEALPAVMFVKEEIS